MHVLLFSFGDELVFIFLSCGIWGLVLFIPSRDWVNSFKILFIYMTNLLCTIVCMYYIMYAVLVIII